MGKTDKQEHKIVFPSNLRLRCCCKVQPKRIGEEKEGHSNGGALSAQMRREDLAGNSELIDVNAAAVTFMV